MNDTTTEPTAAEMIEMEVTAHRNHIINSLHTRKFHPTYGVTKTALNAELHQLEGLLYALYVVVFNDRSVMLFNQAERMADILGWSLNGLHAAVKAS